MLAVSAGAAAYGADQEGEVGFFERAQLADEVVQVLIMGLFGGMRVETEGAVPVGEVGDSVVSCRAWTG